MTHKQWTLIAALVFVMFAAGLSYTLLGLVPAVVFTVAFGGGVVLWLATTYRTQVDPLKIIIPYLLTVIFFIIHVYEEYITDFEVAMTDITGFHILERNFLTISAFSGPVLWLTGAILLLKRTHVGYYFLSVFYVNMLLAELAHFVFPFMEDGTFHYVSGMYTAALPLLPAGYGLYITLREIRNANSPSTKKATHVNIVR
jgi:hypothetical protein